jgi:hypothetical protein
MRAETLIWKAGVGWSPASEAISAADLVFYFGSRERLFEGAAVKQLKSLFPASRLIGCSSGGHILGDDVLDDEIAALVLGFEDTPIKVASADVTSSGSSRVYGAALGSELAAPDLSAVFLLSDGLQVNGAQLVAGMISAVGPAVRVAGGLASDGAEFTKTLVGVDQDLRSGQIVAVGFYGSKIQVTTGSAGGWNVFGPKRRITRSQGNVLFELDGEPALKLYERYLGREAKDLPGSGLLFPLRVFDPEKPDHDIVRTILAVDRVVGSMTFAGDMPQDWTAQLMRGTHRNLVDGAANAAVQARDKTRNPAQAALMVSCIGRRLLMGQRVTDEVEAVSAALGVTMPRVGFYSNGELAPHGTSDCCELHNQTMTITTFAEAC